MTLTVQIDETACAAHGDCAAIAPEVFELGEVARVIATGPDDLLQAAAEACPSMAIVLLDDGGAQVYP